MESGHVRRPQAARSTGRPQYHGGSRGMRDEEMRNKMEKGGKGGRKYRGIIRGGGGGGQMCQCCDVKY